MTDATTEPGPLIILSGPSGSGKSSLVRALLAEKQFPLRLSVSATTRPPRANEIDGVHYHFWDRDRFERERRAGAFLECAEVYGEWYGTLRAEVDRHRRAGAGVLLEIDVQGAAQAMKLYPEHVSIFVMASSLEEYERRLKARGSETEQTLRRRLDTARAELERAGDFQARVLNDDFPTALAQLRGVVAEAFRR